MLMTLNSLSLINSVHRPADRWSSSKQRKKLVSWLKESNRVTGENSSSSTKLASVGAYLMIRNIHDIGREGR